MPIGAGGFNDQFGKFAIVTIIVFALGDDDDRLWVHGVRNLSKRTAVGFA